MQIKLLLLGKIPIGALRKEPPSHITFLGDVLNNGVNDIGRDNSIILFQIMYIDLTHVQLQFIYKDAITPGGTCSVPGM